MGLRLRKDERRTRILEELRFTPHVRISALAGRFGVTTETVRRDLDALSDMGLVDRAYGGASVRPMGIQPSIAERREAMVGERARIGAAAAALVEPGEVVMIDAGSTTTELARHLTGNGRDLTVISNSYPVASELAASRARVILCPGDFSVHEGAVFGEDTADFLRRFYANTAFIGASGLTAGGITDVNSGAAWVKRVMLERSERAYLLVDHTKFSVHVLELVAPLNVLDGIVTDRPPPQPLARSLKRAGVDVHVARESLVNSL